MKSIFQKKFDEKRKELKEWLCSIQKGLSLPLYTSIDLRDAGFKISPIDTNLFAAGFNNLTLSAQKKASDLFKSSILQRFPHTKKIALFCEEYTSNKPYLDNVSTLKQILENAGFETFISTWTALPLGKVSLESASKGSITLHQATTQHHKVHVEKQIVDILISNRDFSEGVPPQFENLDQPIIPPLELGWHKRKKHTHFQHYNRLIEECAAILSLDPWFFSAYFARVEDISFKEDKGLEKIAEKIEEVLKKIQGKYKEHHIERRPFVFVKNNSGTYGRGILTFYAADEIFSLNRKQRQEMFYGKNKQPITDVLIQEGVPTSKIVRNCIGEPVIYLVHGKVVGGFARIHCNRTEEENLNIKGMRFEPFDCDSEFLEKDCTFGQVYGILAHLSCIAAALEEKEYS